MPCFFVHVILYRKLFLYFLVRQMLPAPIAVFFEVNFALDLFAIAGRKVVDPLTLRAGEFYQMIL